MSYLFHFLWFIKSPATLIIAMYCQRGINIGGTHYCRRWLLKLQNFAYRRTQAGKKVIKTHFQESVCVLGLGSKTEQETDTLIIFIYSTFINSVPCLHQLIFCKALLLLLNADWVLIVCFLRRPQRMHGHVSQSVLDGPSLHRSGLNSKGVKIAHYTKWGLG